MKHDGRVCTLLAENQKAGITKTVIHSVAVSWEKTEKINQFIAGTVKANPERLVGFAAIHPSHPKLTQALEEAKTMGLEGIKIHPDFQRFAIDDPKAFLLYEWAQAKAFPLLVHVGDTRYNYSHPQKMAKVLTAFPKLKVICAHLGGWSQWKEGYKYLTKFENAWIDTSSSLYALSCEEAKQIIEAFDSTRILFGTDYPMWSPKEEVKRIEKLKLPSSLLENILVNNAKRLLE
ncbi:MAG: amidohydrolase family protein [Clostridiales bacterium]|nr:amidohydrolase family protein [Clostridiales bacterium]